MDLDEQIRHVADSHVRLLDWLAGLPTPDPNASSMLPGWTISHVMTHIARNADSFEGMLSAAARSEVRQQYPGGPAQREADIEMGAGRPWAVLVDDVAASSRRLDDLLASTDPTTWEFGSGKGSPFPSPLRDIPHRRFREVEIHRLDLGLGATWRDWPAVFVADEWPRSVERLPERLPSGVSVRLVVENGATGTIGDEDPEVEVSGTSSELLAWMTGRHRIPGAPPLDPWP